MSEQNMRASEFMDNVFVNPGAGPVGDDSNLDHAWEAIAQFCDDLDLAPIGASYVGPSGDGRYSFKIEHDGRTVEVDMPGLPLKSLRWIKSPNQNIWDFPRLYVDGSSWVWMYAVSIAIDGLTGVESDSDEVGKRLRGKAKR